MKRLLSLILALLLCFSLLAGCDGYSYDDDDDDDEDDRKSSFFGEEAEDATEQGSVPATTAPTAAPTAGVPGTEAPETTAKPTPEQPAKKTPLQLYTDYLVNGGYNTLTGESVGSYWTVETCQLDLNDDGTPELLVQLTNKEYMGTRGYPSYCFLLATQNGKVVSLLDSYYGGGSMGGDYLRVRQNEMAGCQVIAREGDWHDGAMSAMSTLEVYRYNGRTLEISFFSEAHLRAAEVYADEIKDIQASTGNWKLEGGVFYYWIADGQYVTEDNYNAANSPYPRPQFNVMVTGTLHNPLNI